MCVCGGGRNGWVGGSSVLSRQGGSWQQCGGSSSAFHPSHPRPCPNTPAHPHLCRQALPRREIGALQVLDVVVKLGGIRLHPAAPQGSVCGWVGWGGQGFGQGRGTQTDPTKHPTPRTPHAHHHHHRTHLSRRSPIMSCRISYSFSGVMTASRWKSTCEE